MSTFSVKTQPSQLYLGEQPDVTLYNEGPSTVYFDSNASVTPDSGFPLPPTGQMSWKHDQNLWCCTKLGTAKVYSNPFGLTADTARASFDRLILESNLVNTSTTDYMECGFANTLNVERQTITTVTMDAVDTTVEWYDEALRLIDSQTWNQWIMESVTAYATVPVRGKYCRFILGDAAGRTIRFRVTGTDRTIGFQSWTDVEQLAPTAVISECGLWRTIDGTFVPSTARILNQWGRRIQLTFSGNVTTAGVFIIYDATQTTRYAAMSVPLGNGTTQAEFIVPTSRQLALQSVAPNIVAVSAGTGSLSVVWEDYNK